MRDPRTPLKDALRQATADALEALAADLLDLNKLRAALTGAAREGAHALTIRVPRPVDLSRTEAAIAAVGHLKSQGLDVSWQLRPVPVPDGGPGGHAHDLHVGWGPERLRRSEG